MLSAYAAGKVTEATLSAGLLDAVDKADVDVALEHAAATTKGLTGGDEGGGTASGGAQGGPIFLSPAGVQVWGSAAHIHTDLAVFQLLPGLWK